LNLSEGWIRKVLRVRDYYWLLSLVREENALVDVDTGRHDCGIPATEKTVYHRFGNNWGIKTFYNTLF